MFFNINDEEIRYLTCIVYKIKSQVEINTRLNDS